MSFRRSKLLLGLFSMLVVAAATGTAQAATRTVCASGCNFTKIQLAINASLAGDTVLVKNGTYFENILVNKAIFIVSEKGASTTIIDGRNNTRGAAAGSVAEITAGATLDGFTISNGTGKANANGERFGGGINCLNASPVIRNCVISYNSTPGWHGGGGGIWIEGELSSPVISNCTIRNNTASDISANGTGGGGGIAVWLAANPTISDCVISNNGAGYGGGIYLGLTRGTITRSTVSNNTANGFNTIGGGGIYIVNSTPAITNCVINGNTAFGYSLSGGGMAIAYDAAPIITNCTITNNASSGVGGVFVIQASPTITNSIVTDGLAELAATSTISYSDVQGGAAGIGNIDLDPQFVSGTDFHLAAGSPCIDTGTNSGAPVDDRDGSSRPQNSITDMGAYEYVTQSTKITITKGLYDYLADNLDVNATTTLNLGTSKLYCNGYAMVWDSKLKAWKMPANVFFTAPQRITVCAPGVNLAPCRSQE